MPYYAYVQADLRCPSCGAPVSDMVVFSWGFCPGSVLRDTYLYHLGDPIYWRRLKDGSAPAWTDFLVGEKGANIGDPAITNLIARDMQQFYWTDPAERLRCGTCRNILEGAAVEIREGLLVRAWIYQPGDLDNDIDLYVIQDDGTLKPIPEWGFLHNPSKRCIHVSSLSGASKTWARSWMIVATSMGIGPLVNSYRP